MSTGRIPSTEGGIQPTTVDAKGDLIVGVAADTVSRLAVGNNGETLLADSTATTGLKWSSNVAGGRNFIINGAFDFWQRGTSFTSPGSVYTADRWVGFDLNGSSTYVFSRQTSWLDGFNYSMRVQRSSGKTGTSACYLAMCFESDYIKVLEGKTVTVSFYARSGANYSPTSSQLNVYMGISKSTNGTVFTGGTDEIGAIDQNIVLTTTGSRFSWTFSVPTGYKSARLQLGMTGVGTASTNDWYEITGVQWEVGSTPTTFSRAGGTLQGELAACQRYFQVYGGNITNEDIVNLQAYSSTQFVGSFAFNEMRIAPTFTIAAASNFDAMNSTYGAITATAFGAANISKNRAQLSGTVASGLTAGNVTIIRGKTTASTIQLSAEL